MTYQKCSKSEGFVTADAIVAIGLAVVFASLLAAASAEARRIFDQAATRRELLDQYEAEAETIFGTDDEAVPFGNDRVEATAVVESSDKRHSVSFSRIRAYPYGQLSDAAGAPLCSTDFAGDGGRLPPYPTVKPIALPVDPLLPLTDLEVRGSIAYVSADSSVGSDPDIMAFDISDSGHPKLVSSLDTGPGLVDIAVSGRHIFAAAASTAAQLHSIIIGPGRGLSLEGMFRVPLPSATSTYPRGSAVGYEHGRAYLGTERWDGPELIVVDVSDPTTPRALGGYEVGSKVESTAVHRNIVFLATAGDPGQLERVDATDPLYLARDGSAAFSGSGRQAGRIASIFEDTLVLGRTSGGFDIRSDHELFSWASSTDIASPTASANIPGGVYGAVADRSRIYVATREMDKEFRIFDRKLATTTTRTVSLPVAPQALTCYLDRLYLLAHTAPVIYEISL